MKKTANKLVNKLTIAKETVRELQVPELTAVAGGASVTCVCGSCGRPRSTCPV